MDVWIHIPGKQQNEYPCVSTTHTSNQHPILLRHRPHPIPCIYKAFRGHANKVTRGTTVKPAGDIDDQICLSTSEEADRTIVANGCNHIIGYDIRGNKVKIGR